ncbi:MAG: hypothetical protein CR986_03155 [Ignavibacteriae bacterium]|nr:MAG: hypothetical protein CR986_03155 [Ignavibacteriota bacterium]
MKNLAIIFFAFLFTLSTFAQSDFYNPIDIDTISWSYDDFGKMWTFDDIPFEYFKSKYNFSPSKEWLEDVQKSALQFGGGCSAAFVSEDGLIMTNHHCGRGQLRSIQKEGENLLEDGFYAKYLKDERKIKNLYVDQLIKIEDVTNDVKNFMSKGKNDKEKVDLRKGIIDSLQRKYNKETGLNCKVVTLYNGSKYSMYCYKRYTDIRLVMAPDFQIAATGWDWDNFTYPRYELDFMFYRAYDENGKPVKSDNYFKWSNKGADEGELIFVVGRPGRTDRLFSYAELEYMRDYSYRNALIGFNSIYDAYFDLYKDDLQNQDLLNSVMGWGNARKSYAGRLKGLRNKIIMKKKKDFEKDLKEKVKGNEELNKEYGELWNSIQMVIDELKNYNTEVTALRFMRFIKPLYSKVSAELLRIAEQKKLPNEDRGERYKDENLDSTIAELYPDKIDERFEMNMLNAQKTFLQSLLGVKHDLVRILYPKEKMNLTELINSSIVSSKEKVMELAKKESDEILNYDDPFLKFNIFATKLSDSLNPKMQELYSTLSVLNQSLGEVISKIHKDKIPPDATSTLRISDGEIKGYEYNGTLAPGKNTFYGLWDRYYSFGEKIYPWGLHKRWKTPPADLDLSRFIGFASNTDIVGGNSGSSIINKNQEVIGLAHDGNLESLAGHTIFLEENNRTVASDSDGIMQSLIHIYKTDRLVDELKNGKIKEQ